MPVLHAELGFVEFKTTLQTWELLPHPCMTLSSLISILFAADFTPGSDICSHSLGPFLQRFEKVAWLL